MSTKQNKTKLCSGCRPGLYFALLLTLDTDSKNKCFIFIHITSCIFSPTYSQTFFGNSTISHSIFKNPSYSRLHKYHKVQRGGNSFFQEFLLFCKHVYIFTISQLKISGLSKVLPHSQLSKISKAVSTGNRGSYKHQSKQQGYGIFVSTEVSSALSSPLTLSGEGENLLVKHNKRFWWVAEEFLHNNRVNVLNASKSACK